MSSTITQPSSRVQLLDILRGIALCGIIYMNIDVLFRISNEAIMAEKELKEIFTIFFKTKFYTIFSLLFGVGVYIFMRNAKAKQERPYMLYTKRLVLLLIFGIVHAYFHPGEALTMYAIIGFLLFPAFYLHPAFNFIIFLVATAMTGVVAASQFSVLAMFYLGYFLGQVDFFSQIKKYSIYIFLSLLIGAAFAVYSNLYLVPFYFKTSFYFKILALTGMAQSIAYMSAIVLVYQYVPFSKILLQIFAPMGRMALTNYILQTAFILIISAVFQLNSSISYSDALWIATGILIFQLIYSHIYFRYFDMGPLEKVWRKYTYAPFLLKKKKQTLQLD